MASEGSPRANEQVDSRSLALLPGELPLANGANGFPSATPRAELPMADLTAYVHAFRRHWLLAMSIGVLLGSVAAVGVYFAVGTRYKAVSQLRIDLQEKALAFQTNTAPTDRDRFEIFKNTQREMLLSRFVLLSALRKRDVQSIPDVQEEQRTGDAVEWLKNRLTVSFPGRAEVMEVSVTRPKGKEAAALVAAVVDSYLNEVVNADRDGKRIRLLELEKVCFEKDQLIRNKRQELKKLVGEYGTPELETLSIKQKMVLEELSLLRTEMYKAQAEIRKVESNLLAARALSRAIDTTDVPAQELDELIALDPVAKQLSMELAFKKMNQVYTQNTLKQNGKNSQVDRIDREIQMIQQQYDERVGSLAAKVREKKRANVQMEIVKLDTALTALREQHETIAKEVEKRNEESQKFGYSSVELEMLRSELRQLDSVLTELVSEREKVRVELRSTPRVSLIVKAEEPPTPSNSMARAMLAVLAGLGGMFLPAVCLVLLDVRGRRVNTTEDVSKRLQLPVLGALPLIPSKVIHHLGSGEKRYHIWQARLTESVDGISARLLRKADRERCQIIMVSSAVSGEGKTTLATQLALSFARINRRTVLVDFDLRRPGFDEVFGVPLEPGVCDVLRHSGNVGELVKATGTPNLSVLTAGRWDRLALAALSNGIAGEMFKELREDFDFVIVDTSPLLPIADARFVSQHVDTVVLSVLRDISKLPKLQAACDILDAFGIRSVEAVVTGPSSNGLGKHMMYESTITA